MSISSPDIDHGTEINFANSKVPFPMPEHYFINTISRDWDARSAIKARGDSEDEALRLVKADLEKGFKSTVAKRKKKAAELLREIQGEVSSCVCLKQNVTWIDWYHRKHAVCMQVTAARAALVKIATMRWLWQVIACSRRLKRWILTAT